MTIDEHLWIRRFHQAGPNSPQLVCFPAAGGSASFYYPFSTALSPGIEVSAVQYPGRQDRRGEPNIPSIPQLADAIFPEVEPLAGRPLAFFGHSMGAILAYEVAIRMERAGLPRLERLYVSGRRAPSCHREESVHRGSDDEIIAELRELSGTEARLLADREIVDLILPAVRSDYQAVETYRYEPGLALGVPVTAMTGDDDPRVTTAEAQAWGSHTSASFQLHVLPGGHFYLVKELAPVAKLIAAGLS
jgi:surfactin synthase thioesterase subunit